jgi:NDP-sugar pyrophosphorylase family protein
MPHNTRAMILAAGFGTRLRPLTLTTPKPLIEVGGEPLILRTIRSLRAAGVQDIVVNLHHLGDRIRETLGSGEQFGVKLTYSEEKAILGSGGGIKLAEAHLSAGTFFVVNGDAFLDLDYAEVLRFHQARGAMATMVLRPDNDPEKWGAIEIDGDNRIRQFVHKLPAVEQPLRKLMFTGVHVLEPDVFSYLPLTFSSINEVFYPRAIAENRPIFGYVYEGYWSDVGTWESLDAVRKDFAEGRLQTG